LWASAPVAITAAGDASIVAKALVETHDIPCVFSQ
jgi:hypothetical protein